MPERFSWNTQPQPIIALSPMADMTDSAFCRVVKSITPSSTPLVMFREMVSAEAVVRGNAKTLNMTDIHPDERPLVQQIFGADPEMMAEAAAKIYAEHAPEAFDINMGCPVYKIVHNFNGAALMREPERAVAIVKAVKAAIPVPLSVKIRTGWSDGRDCLTFAPTLEAAGADLITIHGRTKAQGYSGTSDWNRIAEVKKTVQIPVLANGDIHTPERVEEALAITGCDGVLIARGALGNPWFFADTAQLLAHRTLTPRTFTDRAEVIRRHAMWHLEQYGEHGMKSFRKHLTWYVKGLPFASRVRESLSSLSTLTDLERLLSEIELSTTSKTDSTETPEEGRNET